MIEDKSISLFLSNEQQSISIYQSRMFFCWELARQKTNGMIISIFNIHFRFPVWSRRLRIMMEVDLNTVDSSTFFLSNKEKACTNFWKPFTIQLVTESTADVNFTVWWISKGTLRRKRENGTKRKSIELKQILSMHYLFVNNFF